MILVFGGWSGGNATNILEAYDVRADKWTVVSTQSGKILLVSNLKLLIIEIM